MCRAVALLCSLAASKALAPPRRLQKLTEQLPIMEHPTESVYALEGGYKPATVARHERAR